VEKNKEKKKVKQYERRKAENRGKTNLVGASLGTKNVGNALQKVKGVVFKSAQEFLTVFSLRRAQRKRKRKK
jgi:hypothetical protein